MHQLTSDMAIWESFRTDFIPNRKLIFNIGNGCGLILLRKIGEHFISPTSSCSTSKQPAVCPRMRAEWPAKRIPFECTYSRVTGFSANQKSDRKIDDYTWTNQKRGTSHQLSYAGELCRGGSTDATKRSENLPKTNCATSLSSFSARSICWRFFTRRVPCLWPCLLDVCYVFTVRKSTSLLTSKIITIYCIFIVSSVKIFFLQRHERDCCSVFFARKLRTTGSPVVL